jgi:hypothetical protein
VEQPFEIEHLKCMFPSLKVNVRCPESANTIWLPKLIADVVAAAIKNIAAMIILF